VTIDEKLIAFKQQLAELQSKIKVENETVVTNIDLDEDDSIRIENIALKERVFELERQYARSNFYTRIVSKYKIDTSKFELIVDAQSKKILLTPK